MDQTNQFSIKISNHQIFEKKVELLNNTITVHLNP